MTNQKNVIEKTSESQYHEWPAFVGVSKPEWDALQAIAKKYRERDLDKVINTILHRSIESEVEIAFENDPKRAQAILAALIKDKGAAGETILDQLKFSDNEKKALTQLAVLLEQDTLGYLSETLQDSVEGHLRDLYAEDLHITEAEQETLSKLWHHKDIDWEAGEPFLKALGIRENQAAVIRRLAEAEQEEDIAAYCRAHIIMIAKGQIANPEHLGTASSRRLSELLEKED